MPADVASREHLVKRATQLSCFTIAYNLIEGTVSVALGVSEESVALAGFGADSFIEVASAVLVLWRFKGEAKASSGLSIDRERRATLGIGVLFLLLAAGASAASIVQLLSRAHPETTLPGMIISGLSLSFMFYLWRAKLNVGHALASATVLKDAACSLACIQLSFVLFAGSLVYFLVPGLWWADASAALVLSVFIVKEGWQTVQAARSEEFSGGGCGCIH